MYSALSAGVYTTTLLVMVDRVKGRAPLALAGWVDFTIMMECMLCVYSVLNPHSISQLECT
jgi:hypothetical protein